MAHRREVGVLVECEGGKPAVVEGGHLSSALCHTGMISHRPGPLSVGASDSEALFTPCL